MRSCAPILAAMLAVGGVGVAEGFVPWSNANGSAAFFNWQNGGSDNGLYGDPVLVNGNTFVLSPSNFRATSANGAPAAVGDRLVVEILANPGLEITGISITEFGDFGVFGNGSVTSTGVLQATDLNNVNPVRSANLAHNPAMPITAGTGEWTGAGALDLTVDFPAWTMLRLELTDNLLALSSPGGVSFIEKKVVGAGIAITVIPEPSALALLALGGLAALRRR
jgi:hypothetical protein